MKKFGIFLLLLALGSFVAVPATAQDTGTGTTSGAYGDREDDGPDLGWLGLIGLAGLMGLKRRSPDTYRETATRPGTAATR